MKSFILSLALCLICAGGAVAQGCALCTKTASDLGAQSAKGLNNGILYLAALPLAFIGTVGFIWWRRNHAAAEEE